MSEEESKEEAKEESSDEEETVEEVKPKYSNDYLLEILNSLALSILNKKVINCKPGEYVLSIEDDLINEWNMTSGNPVIIRIQSTFILKQLQKKETLYALARGLELALETVHRMRHTLSIVPVADVLWRTDEMRKWRKAAKDKALYYDKLVPADEVTYTETVFITAVHKVSGLRASVSERIGKANPEHMRTAARKLLTKAIKENKNAPERNLTVSEPNTDERRIQQVGFREPATWSSIPRGFQGNDCTSVEDAG